MLRVTYCIMFVLIDGLWNSDKPTLLKLGVLPVKAMLAVEEHLWASSGGQVFIISTNTHCVEVHHLGLILQVTSPLYICIPVKIINIIPYCL